MMDWKEKRLWKKRGNGFLWDWYCCEYFIIDDPQPEIDWEGFDWEFFNQYGGVQTIKVVDGSFNSLSGPPLNDYLLRLSPFYPWFGGKCPVPGNVEVEVILRSEYTTTARAEELNWSIDAEIDNGDVIAFRLTGRVL